MLLLVRVVLAAFFCSMFALSAGAATLEGIYKLAQQNDALLKAQSATAQANRETGNIYRAVLLPQINAGLSQAKSDTDIKGTNCDMVRAIDKSRANCSGVNTTTKRNSVTLTQQLVNAELWYDYKKGEKITKQADAQWLADELSLIVRVTDAYVNVLRTIDTYNTARTNEEAIARQLEQTQQRFNVGLIAITDVQESKASYDTARVDTLNARGNIGIAFEAVQVLTGEPLLDIAPLSEALPVRMPEPQERKKWEDVALENNPELVASALAFEAARENAKARRAAHLPTVSGSLQYNDSRVDSRFHPGSSLDDQTGNTIGVSLTVPLYSGGGISAASRQAYQQQMAAEDTLNNNRRNIVQQARSFQLAVNTDIARIAAGKQAIVSAQSAVDATQAGYDVGTRNIVDVLTSQQLLFKAKLAYSNARYQYILDALRLQQTAGTLSEDNLLKLNAWLLPEKSLARASYGI